MKLSIVNIGFCKMSAELFEESVRRGYDSEDFITKLMNSETAVYLYHADYREMWRGAAYIMQTLEKEVRLKKGKTYSEDFMSWVGYLFECWKLTYPEETAKDIIRQAPVDVLLLAYQGLHVMAFEDAILELKEISKENMKIS